MKRNPRACGALLLVVFLALIGCARSPEANKIRHVSRGDRYFARHQFAEAIIEYKSVLGIDPSDTHTIERLAIAYYEVGQVGQALPYLLRARDIDPHNTAVRSRLGTLYLLSRRSSDARAEAAAILEQDPHQLDGLLLAAATATTPAEVDEEIRRLQDAREAYPETAKLYDSLGVLYLRKNAAAEAERAFREATARDPKSIQAHLMLGDFYMSRRDVTHAEQEYKAAAAIGSTGSLAQMRLADFYFAMQRPDEGKRVLYEVTAKSPEFLPAWRRLSEIALVERRYDDAMTALAPVFKKNGKDLEGQLLRGRIHLARAETADAIEDFQGILKAEPRFASARYQLALAQVAIGNVEQAKAELKDIAPDFPDAALLLAELHLQTGAPDPAIDILTGLLAKGPNFQAYVLLGSAYLRKKEPATAASTFQSIVARAPQDPRGPYLVGLAVLAQGKRAQAKQEFEDALALAPDYLEPLAQLADLAIAERQADAAIDRVQRQMARAPKSARIPYLLGRIYERRGDVQRAEHAYLKALELEPAMAASYVALGGLYANSGNYDLALQNISEALKRNPKDLVAQMLQGVIYERKGDTAKATKAYEKALATNPRFAPAANNLAYLYAEHGGDPNRALTLAQLAKETAPDEPRVSDTLGWILYKRGVYERALALLKESATKLPDNMEVQYHLGMTYAKLGDKDNAKQALGRAVSSPADFTGKDQARRLLSDL